MAQLLATAVAGPAAGQAVGQAMAAKQAYDSFRGGDPGVPNEAQSQIPQMPSLGDASQTAAPVMPTAQVAPSLPGPDMSSGGSASMLSYLMGNNAANPTSPPPPAPQGTPNNVYTPDSGAGVNPADMAASIGTGQATTGPNGEIIVPGKDEYQPQHHEGLLAKIGDALLMMRGQQPIFRQRTIQANERDVLKGYDPNDPNAVQHVVQHLESIPGADPALGMNVADQAARAQYYSTGANMRSDNRLDKGLGIISSAFGPQGALSSDNPQAAQNYQNMLPLLRKTADTFGIPADMQKTMLPDQYDPNMAKNVATMGVSGYDQARIQLGMSSQQNEEAYRNEDIDLRKGSQQLQARELNIRAQEAASTMAKNSSEYLTSKQKMVTTSLGPQVTRALPWLFNGFMTNKWSPQVQVGKLYSSPDGSMAARPMANGQWKIYQYGNNGKTAYYRTTLGGAADQPVSTDQNGDYAQ